MARELRKATGMREKSPGVWELVVSAGRDPVTGRYRQLSRTFHGNLRDAKKARAALVAEVGQGRHDGANATVDQLCTAWLAELERKGRSPNTIHNYRKTYRHDIAPTLSNVKVTKVTTKMLTDLYGEHQRRGLAARSVYQIHATISSMMTQACRWGWRTSNPAQWAEPPSLPNVAPVVPTPDQVVELITAAEQSRRPEYARLIFIAATTGLRRGELCALRWVRDVDSERRLLTVSQSILESRGEGLVEAPTKNRQTRLLAVDERTMAMLAAQMEAMKERAVAAHAGLVPDSYVFSDAIDGSEPWRPGAITLYFTRLRKRVGLEHLTFHSLRKFMGTYGQDLGFSPVQVAMRAGHDPSVAAKHYTGNVAEADRALADAISQLLSN
ncbi:MAG: tyrosine-type recombinase/integrase [Acidimicrobiales bacterium]